MNNFDGSRIKEMDEFLKFLGNIKTHNGRIDHDLVYSALCTYNLKDGERVKNSKGQDVLDGVSVRGYFPMWTERFQNRNNIYSFVSPDWRRFCQFVSQKNYPHGPYIKLYIPLDHAHLYNGANMIFDFIDKNNIHTASKIGDKMRVDNVIVRLDINDTKSAQMIIDFVHNTPYLRDGMNKVNPFIPTINGVGYMKERGNSYNSDMSHFIVAFINRSKQNGWEISADQFKAFLDECQRKNASFNPDEADYDPDLSTVFNGAYTGKNKDLGVRKEFKEGLTTEQKRALVMDALRATYRKYGLEQIRTAITAIVRSNDYGYVTNAGNLKLREKLVEQVTAKELVEFMVEATKYKKKELSELIDIYCDKVLGDEQAQVLDDICKTTLENHGQSQVEGALRRFIFFGQTDAFSRFRGQNRVVNYRDKMRGFNKDMIENVIARCLDHRGIDHRDRTDLIKAYATALAQENYLGNGPTR